MPTVPTTAGPLDTPIEQHLPKREAVYLRLKQAIVEGQLAPGQHLVETEVAARLGVSRNPVREALRKLEQEQLVYASTQGMVVSSISTKTIEEVYGIRALLEGWGCRLAAHHITPLESEHLLQVLARSRAAVEAGDVIGLTGWDVQFHGALIHASRNTTLAKMLDQLRDYVLRFRVLSLSLPGRPEEVLRDHTRIAEAVIAGRGEEAERLVHQHLEEAVLRLLESLPPNGTGQNGQNH
jgi:DNA-binding GntR family transcriptional regulator